MSRSKPPEDGKHLVADGEWVGSIAASYGYLDWDHDVWKRSENASLREHHPDPHVLASGDVLFIPPWEEKKESCATEKKHRFKLKVPSEVLRIRLIGEDDKPLEEQRYILEIDYDPGGGIYSQQPPDTTDKHGVLKQFIPSTTTKGRLRLPNLNREIILKFGYLTPMDMSDKSKLIRGAQQRLLALGFSPGPIDGKDGPLTRAAVRSFQKYCQDNCQKEDPRIIDAGSADGIVGPKTRAALLKAYGA